MEPRQRPPWTDLDRPPLRQAALRAALTGGHDPAWRQLEVVAATGSTNADLAARAVAGAAEGLVLTTDDQTAGRGRLGRAWTSPPRAAIAVSVLLRPAGEPVGAGTSPTGDLTAAPPVDQARWSWLSLLAGLAVVDALTRVCGLPARLKWPNDVLVPAAGVPAPDDADPDLRKVCGLLAEVVTTPTGPAVVLGAGINVSQDAAELPVPTATSLRLAGSATTDRDTVLRAYLRALSARYRRWRAAGGDPRASGVGAAYREACVTIGRDVAVRLPGAEPVTGRAEGVDDDGRLLVATGGRVRSFAAGDVLHARDRRRG